MHSEQEGGRGAVFQRILVPVDLTEKNRHVVEWAAELARWSDGSVTLLHVIEPLDLPFEELEDFYEELEAKAAASMEKMVETLRAAGVECRRQVVYGERAREIVEYAEENGSDLILLSSHRQDLDDPTRNLGTLSHKVAILAQTPVLLVR
ncbi:MAG TPA: universal stress protein [Gemmatimonadota bacterium]|nr:universal stress protein [Gemmatimonadota bacterium]